MSLKLALYSICLALVSSVLVETSFGSETATGSPEIKSIEELASKYSSDKCKDCHERIYDQWSRSQHARPLMGIGGQVFLTRYLKEGPLALKKGEKATKENLICVKCHLPQILGEDVSDTVFEELAAAIQRGDKSIIGKLNIGCPVCHADKAVVHGKAEQGVVYGSRDIPEHPEVPVKKSYLLNNSLLCGQCHGLGPVLDFKNPQQCATLYGSYLHGYIPSGGAKTCQECHMKGGDHYMPPNFNDRVETSSLYKSALPISVEILHYGFHPDEDQRYQKIIVNTKIVNKAGHRIPDG